MRSRVGGGQAGDVEVSVCEHVEGVCACVRACVHSGSHRNCMSLFFGEESTPRPTFKHRQKLSLT